MAVYTALLIPVNAWAKTLRTWLTYRATMYRMYKMPADFELHAAEFVRAGKGRPAPTLKYGINSEMRLRKKAYINALQTIRTMESLRIVSKVAAGSTPEECYSLLIDLLEELMVAESSEAILIVDGDGTQHYQKARHRALKLDQRRVVEDPWFQVSHGSQLVQMADLVAYACFQAHSRRDNRSWMWGWHAEHVHAREWEGRCACP